MPKYLFHWFCLIFLLSGTFRSYAQAEQGARSKNKIILEGCIYYIHIVKQGETLPLLCELYSTTSRIITDENPEALEGIHEGQVLKIPESKSTVESSKFMQPDSGKVHIVQPGQTLYSICKLYGISEEQLERLNPEIKYSNLQVNQVLRIPKGLIEDKPQPQSNQSANYILYTVEPKQTLYSLARIYKVSMDDIKQANLTDGEWKGLKVGEVIRIPNQQTNAQKIEEIKIASGNNQSPTPSNAIIVTQDSVKPLKVSVPVCNCDSIAGILHPGPFNVALILPFSLDQIDMESQIDSLQTEGEEEMRQQEALQASAFKRSSGWVEFYQGALLSLSKLKEQNISVNLFVYDSESDQAKFDAALHELERTPLNLMIAISDSARIKKLSDFSLAKGITLILPVSSDHQIVENNPNVMEFEPGDDVEMDNIVELLKNEKSENLVIIHTPDSSNMKLGNLLFNKIQNALKLDTSLIHLVQYSENQGNFVTSTLHDSIENLVIVLSRREETAGDILRSINNLTIDHQLSVIGLHEWSKYTSIDISYLHRLQVQYFSPFYCLPTDVQYKSYIKEFIKINQYFPSKTSSSGYNYGILAYDIMNYAITALARYDQNVMKCVAAYQPVSYLGPFNFIKLSPKGGWENQKEMLVKYTKNYEVFTELAPALKSSK